MKFLFITSVAFLIEVSTVSAWRSHVEEVGTRDVVYNAFQDNPSQNVILWWTEFTQTLGVYKKCGEGTCYFTEDRTYYAHPNTKAVLFYGSDFSVEDLPLPRPASHWWGLMHEESPKNNPLFDHQKVLELFNLTATFRRMSNFPLTLLSLQSVEALTSRTEFIPTKMKNRILAKEMLAPVVYVYSDCDTPSERDQYVQELSKFIKIDSYGECLHNRDLPEHLRDAASTHNHQEFRSIMAKYKFTLAIENAACDDYITEKFWRPLTLGSVPVYWGSPSVRDWVPNPSSAILISDFDSPRELAKYLYTVLENDQLYDTHLKHKLDMEITNTDLIDAMNRRTWGVDDIDKPSFVDEFECYVCNQILSSQQDNTKEGNRREFQATLDHYGCPVPQQVSGAAPNAHSFWVQQWHKAKVEAETLSEFAQANVNYTAQKFYEKVIERLQMDEYFSRFPPRRDEL